MQGKIGARAKGPVGDRAALCTSSRSLVTMRMHTLSLGAVIFGPRAAAVHAVYAPAGCDRRLRGEDQEETVLRGAPSSRNLDTSRMHTLPPEL